ncbi:glycerol-3-phosphate dehydrogenase subunit GlpB [Serratia entomophila]|uniref:glycerol-3-phosphate dehydrogenase subunit GlpB n=1 Tax=Serratia entomophila TaxID=42906 RepID=UPI00217B0E64|nr:glycerol-3-phosphate dehydrogenase subunit GlpB [Serratia entomophila]CAI1841178.1 Anaerobic glycerol-3-phosphate dehydrogenase subunit B [Serratia entomophila]CAI1881505.1 Anaerobic glycerol-3-phosphate dehydrogenase subunit B [Serratia entomophila]
MRFDAVVIGGGLAGLSCAIAVAERGKRCAVVSAGQSALYFSSGSLDLLAQLPDGTAVDAPLAALAELARQAPQHPYALIGTDRVAAMAAEAQRLLQRCGLSLQGDCERNHQRVTPLGTRRATWLSPQAIPTLPLAGALPWRRIAVIGIEGFLDFQPQLAASSLARELGVRAEVAELHLPALDRLRNNPSEFRAVNIARVLDLAENLTPMAAELQRLAGNAEAIFMPACLGLEDDAPLAALQAAVGKPIRLLPTLPPSVPGMRLHQALRQRFQRLGGVFMPGDSVLQADSEAGRIIGLYTRNHGDIPLRAQQVVLASGSFFSNGLAAAFDGVREPVFGLDVDSRAERADWSHRDLFAPQPYLQFGVRTDRRLRALRHGEAFANLYAIGAVTGGYDPLQQGCGAGVSLIGALHVAQQIAAEETHEPA